MRFRFQLAVGKTLLQSNLVIVIDLVAAVGSKRPWWIEKIYFYYLHHVSPILFPQFTINNVYCLDRTQ